MINLIKVITCYVHIMCINVIKRLQLFCHKGAIYINSLLPEDKIGLGR